MTACTSLLYWQLHNISQHCFANMTFAPALMHCVRPPGAQYMLGIDLSTLCFLRAWNRMHTGTNALCTCTAFQQRYSLLECAASAEMHMHGRGCALTHTSAEMPCMCTTHLTLCAFLFGVLDD